MGNKGLGVDRELFFRALADSTRLRLLNLMSNGEVCVCFLVEILAVSQPKISRHLAYLRRAGMVKGRKDGKWMHYSIVEPPDSHANKVLIDLLSWLAQDPQMQVERTQLGKLCCGIQMPVHLQTAPRPTNYPEAAIERREIPLKRPTFID